MLGYDDSQAIGEILNRVIRTQEKRTIDKRGEE